MTRLVLIRHGETDWNREGRWQGQADVPLNPAGLVQAERMARELAKSVKLDAIYSSDLKRARQTAHALARATHLPVFLEPRLREIHQGEWQGLLVSEIEARYEQIFERRTQDPWNVAPPGGETAREVHRRATEFLSDVSSGYPDGMIALVSHGFVLAVIRTICGCEAIENVWGLVPENCTPVVMECGREIIERQEG